jgi:hypothetical protein
MYCSITAHGTNIPDYFKGVTFQKSITCDKSLSRNLRPIDPNRIRYFTSSSLVNDTIENTHALSNREQSLFRLEQLKIKGLGKDTPDYFEHRRIYRIYKWNSKNKAHKLLVDL